MVTRAQMVEMSRRHDTQIAAAFRRALGIKEWPLGKRKKTRRKREWDPRWSGMYECFKNHHSPMDSGRI